MSSALKVSKRKHTRFRPDPGTYAQIDTTSLKGEFRPDTMALVWSEAYGGCGLIALSTDKLQPGFRCRVQVGKLDPMIAEVRWRMQLDGETIKLGLQFLE